MHCPTAVPSRLALLVLLAALALVTLPADGWTQPGPAAEVKRLRIGISQEPDQLHPFLSSMAVTYEMLPLHQLPLCRPQPGPGDRSEVAPVLCTRMPTLANGLAKIIRNVENDPTPTRRDGEREEDWRQRVVDHKWLLAQLDPQGTGRHDEVEVRWEIDRRAVWEDGTAVTAADFIYTQQLIMSDDPAFPVPSRDMESRVRAMTSEDSGHLLVVRWNGTWANALVHPHMLLPKHIVEPLVTLHGAAFTGHEWLRKPTSNGPWRVAEWKPGESIRFERNPRWWGKQPYFDEIDYLICDDSVVLGEWLAAGRIDATGQIGLSFDDARELEKRKLDTLDLHFTRGLVWEHIDCNLDHPILRDVRVRKALLHGINRDQMVKTLFDGRQPVAHSWVPPDHPAYHAGATRYAFDRAEAGRLLDAAGWTRADDKSMRHNAAGDSLRFTLGTTSGNRVRAEVCEQIRDDLAAIGVDIEIDLVTPDTFFGQEGPLTRRTFDLAMYAWLFDLTSDGMLWTSAQVPTADNAWQGQNFCGLRDTQIDRLESRIVTTLDAAERIDLWHKEQERWTDLLPALPLYYRCDATAVRKTITGWKPAHVAPAEWNVLNQARLESDDE
ncbi:MAG: peptide ABC transporter substrate-binding protein [Planctomycetota bacterium]